MVLQLLHCSSSSVKCRLSESLDHVLSSELTTKRSLCASAYVRQCLPVSLGGHPNSSVRRNSIFTSASQCLVTPTVNLAACLSVSTSNVIGNKTDLPSQTCVYVVMKILSPPDFVFPKKVVAPLSVKAQLRQKSERIFIKSEAHLRQRSKCHQGQLLNRMTKCLKIQS